MNIILHILVSAVAVLVTGRLLTGVRIDGFGTAIAVAVVLGIVNGVLGPIILALTLPLNVLTLGLLPSSSSRLLSFSWRPSCRDLRSKTFGGRLVLPWCLRWSIPGFTH